MDYLYLGLFTVPLLGTCIYIAYELHCIRRGIPVKKHDIDKDKYI